MNMTTTERKKIISVLKQEHEDYFQTIGNINALYIPKMAYRPSGKDELYVTFFPSELENEADIYTEFVSIDYVSEDLKRTLYRIDYNPHWKSEYELITSKSGFQRHLIPVSELTIINDITTKNKKVSTSNVVTENIQTDLFSLSNPDAISDASLIANKLEDINQSLITLTKVITKLIK